MAIARVQGKQAQGTPVTTVTATFDAVVTVGNLIVVSARAGGSRTFNTPTDDKGHTYTACMAQVNSGAIRARMWYAVATVAGMTQVTVTLDASTYMEVDVGEYSGLHPVPLGNTSSGTGTGTGIAVTSFNTAPGNLIVSYATTAVGTTYTAGANYAISIQGSVAASQYRLSSDPSGSETAPMTRDGGGSVAWIEVAAAFKARPDNLGRPYGGSGQRQMQQLLAS